MLTNLEPLDGDRSAYLLGERHTMAAVRNVLGDWASGDGQLSVKGYWDAEQAPSSPDTERLRRPGSLNGRI